MKRTRQFQPGDGTAWSGAASYQAPDEEPPHAQMRSRAKRDAEKQQTLSKGGRVLKWITVGICVLLGLLLWGLSELH